MDISPQSAIDDHHSHWCHIFHATEEGGRELEEVMYWNLSGLLMLMMSRKVQAVDFIGAFLALGGSTLIVVSLIVGIY